MGVLIPRYIPEQAGRGGRWGFRGYLVQERERAHQMWGLGLGQGWEHQGQALAQPPTQGREPVHLGRGRVLVLGLHFLGRVLAQGQLNW